jgi:ferritin
MGEAPMITPKMQDALCAHVEQELYSAYLYLAMSAWCEAKTFKGFGRWLRVQHEEELDHARKVLDFVLARGGQPALGAIPAPPREFGSMLQVFEAVLDHEKKVTERILGLNATAAAERDATTQIFLQWFITEQVEEEAAATEIVEKLRMVSYRPGTALYLDKEYGKRGKAA